jgi:3'(2'), 5'-bisphosphate nucleotidase
LLIEEAGGTVTDSKGNPLNFGLGRTLGKNNGIVACSRYLHPKVLDAIRVALKERKRAKSREALKTVSGASKTANAHAHRPDRPKSREDEKENRPANDSDSKL